jgi:hypothetical protein
MLDCAIRYGIVEFALGFLNSYIDCGP